MALSDINIADFCGHTVDILANWTETLEIRRLGGPVAFSYDSTGAAVRDEQVIATFLGDWQDAVVFGPCSLAVQENDRIYRADGTFEYVNYFRNQEDHAEIFLTRVLGSD
jgi:hypothetical protein